MGFPALSKSCPIRDTVHLHHSAEKPNGIRADCIMSAK